MTTLTTETYSLLYSKLQAKRRTFDRFKEANSTVSLDNPYDMAITASKASQITGAIDVLEEMVADLVDSQPVTCSHCGGETVFGNVMFARSETCPRIGASGVTYGHSIPRERYAALETLRNAVHGIGETLTTDTIATLIETAVAVAV